MTNPPVTEEAVERAVDGLVQLHRKLLACFQSPTGEPPPRRPKQFEPTMKDCDAVLSAAVELERVKAALKSPPTVSESELLRADLAKAAELAELAQCEACLAHLLPDDDYVVDDSGCTICVPALDDEQPKRPCYAYRSLDRTVANAQAASARSCVANLNPSFLSMNGRDKWETLVLSGLIGTDEPWIEAVTETLRAEALAMSVKSEATQGGVE